MSDQSTDKRRLGDGKMTTFIRQFIVNTIIATCISALILGILALLSGDVEATRALVPFAVLGIILGAVAETATGDIDRH